MRRLKRRSPDPQLVQLRIFGLARFMDAAMKKFYALLSILGAFVAFGAGLVALKWLSGWLERGRWYLFGIYCLVAATAVYGLHSAGY